MATNKAKKNTQKPDPRRLAAPNYKTLRLHKRIKHQGDKLPSAYKVFKSSVRHVFRHWRIFAGITLVYLLLTFLLVKGLSGGTNVTELKDVLQELFGSGWGQLISSAALLSVLFSDSTTTGSEVASAYQSILLIMTSLAIIWALRQTRAANPATTKDAFYKGMYPLVPFVFVLLVIGLQLLPLLIGNFIYSTVIGNGLAVTGLEQIIWAMLFFLLALLSIYMISSSVFALYVVTLPDRTPLQSLRSAREIVRYRRWTVLRKVLFLPFILVVLAVVIMIPVILWLTFIASWIFFTLSMAAVVVTHAYLYTLYRELL